MVDQEVPVSVCEYTEIELADIVGRGVRVRVNLGTFKLVRLFMGR